MRHLFVTRRRDTPKASSMVGAWPAMWFRPSGGDRTGPPVPFALAIDVGVVWQPPAGVPVCRACGCPIEGVEFDPTRYDPCGHHPQTDCWMFT